MLLGRKLTTNLSDVLTHRDNSDTKIRMVNAIVFPMVIGTTKSRRICTVILHKTAESNLDCKICDESIAKDINPDLSLEGMHN